MYVLALHILLFAVDRCFCLCFPGNFAKQKENFNQDFFSPLLFVCFLIYFHLQTLDFTSNRLFFYFFGPPLMIGSLFLLF